MNNSLGELIHDKALECGYENACISERNTCTNFSTAPTNTTINLFIS